MSPVSFPVLPSAQAPTSSGDIFAAVKALFDEAFPVATSGTAANPFKAFFRDRIPPTLNITSIGHPYVILTTPTNRRTARSSKSEFWESLVTFKVYHNDHEKAEEALALIGDVFDDAAQDLDFYLQPEGESQSSNIGSESPGGFPAGTDSAPAAGKIMLCDRLNEGFGEEDRVVRFAWMTYRIQRRKRRRKPGGS